VKWPRFSIFDVMALVALVAIDIAALRLLAKAEAADQELAGLMALGVLPLANVLAFGMARLMRARSSGHRARRFWAGFEAFGLVALLLFIAGTSFATHALYQAVDATIRPLVNPGRPVTHIILPALLLPQLAFAILGGWLNTKFRVIITRRTDAPASIVDRPLTGPSRAAIEL
jgi:hypothetical protein